MALSCTQPPGKPARTSSSPSEVEASPAIPVVEERRLDSRLDSANLKLVLPPFLESLGAGWGAGYRPSGFVLISAGGQKLYSQALGRANYAEDRKNTPRTPLAIGDLGQLFSALTVLRLVDQGKISLNLSLGKTLPNCPVRLRSTTVRQLLGHTAGLASLPPSLIPAAGVEREEALDLIWKAPPKFEPGENREVSNTGHAVLLALLESVEHKPYVDIVREQVLDPLGLSGTSLGLNPVPTGAAVRYGASPRDGERQRLAPTDLNSLFAFEEWMSTGNDLVRIQEALTQGTLLSEDSTALYLNSGETTQSFGAQEKTHRSLRTFHYGSGGRSAAAVHSEMVSVPDLDLTVLVLSNSAAFDTQAAAEAALEGVLGQAVQPHKPRREVDLDSDIAEHIRGGYLLSPDAQLALEAKGVPARVIHAMSTASIFLNKEQLFFKPARQGAMRMVPSGPTSFVLRGGKATLSFDIHYERPDSTLLTLRQGTLEVEYGRKPARQPKKQAPTDPTDN